MNQLENEKFLKGHPTLSWVILQEPHQILRRKVKKTPTLFLVGGRGR